MKKALLLFCFATLQLSLTAVAQQKKPSSKKHPAKHHTTTTTASNKGRTDLKRKLPPWGMQQNYHNESGVYFPDYYTFYDPSRGGYVYWQDNRWAFSSEPPVFMREADFGKTRIQVLKDETLQIPEDHYEQYMKLYPPQQTFPSVPVPILTISRDRQ